MPEPLTASCAASAAPRRHGGPLRPPWMLAEPTVRARCSGCGECARACPEGVIARGRGGAPVLDFRGGECTYCAACARACPEGLFALPEPLVPPPRRARVAETCLQRRGVVCAACIEACPRDALRLIRRSDDPRALATVAVESAACDGCGACVGPCPLGAIEILELAPPTHPPVAVAGAAA